MIKFFVLNWSFSINILYAITKPHFRQIGAYFKSEKKANNFFFCNPLLQYLQRTTFFKVLFTIPPYPINTAMPPLFRSVQSSWFCSDVENQKINSRLTKMTPTVFLADLMVLLLLSSDDILPVRVGYSCRQSGLPKAASCRYHPHIILVFSSEKIS